MKIAEKVLNHFRTEIVSHKETSRIVMCLFKNEIFYVYVRKHTLIDMDLVSEISDFLGNQFDKPHYNIVEFEPFSESVNEARDWASGQTGQRVSFADAFVINNLPHKILIDSHQKQNKPKFPTKVFTRVEDSFKWIQEIMEEKN